jgi:hypothetical protein
MKRDWPYYVLVIISSIFFIKNGHTAFDSSLNIYPFLERYFDSDYLLNDFYTNVVSKPNPYHIFGFIIIFFSKLLNIEWYTAVYILKIIVVVFNPIIYYSFFNAIIRSLGYNANKILLFFFIVFLISPLSKLFSIAWWPPYEISFKASTFGILLGMLSFITLQKNHSFYSLFLYFLASLIHPVISLYLLIFVFSFEIFKKNKNIKPFVTFFTMWFVSITILYVLFPTKLISNSDFVNLYAIENHSSHYHLSDFGSYLPTLINWKVSYFFITICFIVIYFILNKVRKKDPIKRLVLLVLAIFNLCILFQYFFIDIFPLRLIAIFSPIRYTHAMFWYFIILSVILFAHKKNQIIKINNGINLTLFTLIIFSCFVYFIDSPKERLYLKNKKLFDFVSKTKPNSIFSLPPSELNFEFSYISKRATIHGIGFPFNQDYIKEYTKRKTSLFGNKHQLDSIEGSWIGEKQSVFYGSLTSNQIKYITEKYGIDFIVFYKKYLKNSKQLDLVFETEELAIYSLK